MNILLIGSGGREHALAWSISASPLASKLYCAPGNAGIAQVAECVPIDAMAIDRLIAFAKENRIDFAITGPEAPLTAGLADRFEAAGIKALGPSAAGARLEASKGFVKDLCREHGIPMATYLGRGDSLEEAKELVERLPHPLVIKADGLAQGKGVIISEDKDTSLGAVFTLSNSFGGSIVFEEFLRGEEASFFALSDGEHVLPLAGAQDHKRAFDGDKGPNTGGMGAYSPAPVLTPALEAEVMARIIRPTIEAMRARGTPYQGVLYAGLMITAEGPKLIEYNCRFGDPECQVLMLRLKSDLLPALIAARDGLLATFDLRWSSDAALTVVMAAKGYPGSYQKGSEIKGLEDAARVEGVEIFHAGTEARDGRIFATGGRVLNVSAVGKTVREAQSRAYEAIARIDWPGGFCRKDIGWRAIARERAADAPRP